MTGAARPTARLASFFRHLREGLLDRIEIGAVVEKRLSATDGPAALGKFRRRAELRRLKLAMVS